MAKTALTVQYMVAGASLTPTMNPADAGNGNYFTNDGKVFLWVRTSGTAATLTIETNGYKVGGVGMAPYTVSLPATGDRVIGLFDPTIFNQSALGGVGITWSVGTGITVAVVHE